MDILDLVHEDRSSGGRPFPCEQDGCGKAFARKSDLVRHVRIHTNERPWLCEWPGCERDFIQRSALIVHTRTHTGERPHRCEVDGCTKAFSDSSSLARHRRIHTGKRPYRCTVRNCLKTFCRKTTLTKHIKRNHPQHAHSPERVSAASFTDDEDEAYDYPASASSLPQSPDEGSAYPTPLLDEDISELPQPGPLAYSSSYSAYYPPSAPHTPDMRARAQLHPHANSPGAWSAPGHVEHRDTQYLSASAPMSRSVSADQHPEQYGYLTPPATTYHRIQRPRRNAPRAHYAEEDLDEFDDGDEEYREESVRTRSSGRGRRGAFTSPNPDNDQRISRRLDYTTPSPHMQPASYFPSPQTEYRHSPQVPQNAQCAPTPQQEYLATPGPSSHPMLQQSYTAPLPQTYTDSAALASHAYPTATPPFTFALSHRRASSAGALEGLLPPPQAFSSPSNSPQLPHAQPLGLGLTLGSNPAFSLSAPHERRLSEVHGAPGPSPTRHSFLDLELPLPSGEGFAFTAAPPRRPSIADAGRFPSLPNNLLPGGQKPGNFSQMTRGLFERMEDEQQMFQASGMVA